MRQLTILIILLLCVISSVYCQNSAVNGGNQAAVQAQVGQHNQLTDCQTVYQNNLYDLTNYRHPAGNALIKPCCGSTGCDGVAAAFHANQVQTLIRKLANFKIPAPAEDHVDSININLPQQPTTPPTQSQSAAGDSSSSNDGSSSSVALTGVKGYIALVCVLSVFCGFFACVSIMLMYQRRKAN
jgi:hypothetical protein